MVSSVVTDLCFESVDKLLLSAAVSSESGIYVTESNERAEDSTESKSQPFLFDLSVDLSTSLR